MNRIDMGSLEALMGQGGSGPTAVLIDSNRVWWLLGNKLEYAELPTVQSAVKLGLIVRDGDVDGCRAYRITEIGVALRIKLKTVPRDKWVAISTIYTTIKKLKISLSENVNEDNFSIGLSENKTIIIYIHNKTDFKYPTSFEGFSIEHVFVGKIQLC